MKYTAELKCVIDIEIEADDEAAASAVVDAMMAGHFSANLDIIERVLDLIASPHSVTRLLVEMIPPPSIVQSYPCEVADEPYEDDEP